MNAEKVLSSINMIVNKYAPNVSKAPELEALVQSLREEIALAEQKKAGKPNRFKAALRVSKRINKDLKDSRPGLAGAFTWEDGKQYLFHSYFAARFDEPFDGLVEAGEGGKPSSLVKMFENYNSRLPVDLPSLAELKTKLKLDKAEGNLDDRGWSLCELDDVFYNTDLLIQCVEMVEPTEAYFSSDGKFPMLVMFGEGAQAVLCPIRRG